MSAPKSAAVLRRYAGAEEGGVMPLIGLAIFALIGTIGLAVDAGRATLVYAKLLTSADAAGLAVGARLNSGAEHNLNAEAEKFVDGNFPDQFAGATVQNVSAVASEDGHVITVTASATMPTTLLRVLGVDNVNVSVTSEVRRAVSGLELVLALDNTGSMVDPPSKLAALKTASHDLLDIVFGEDDAASDLYVGVVPFSQTVNIGRSNGAWVNADTYVWGDPNNANHRWKGCVMARGNGRDSTDDPPSVQRFDRYHWGDTSNSDSPDSFNSDWWDQRTEKYSVCKKYKNNGTCHTWGEETRTVPVYTIVEQDGLGDRSPNKFCPAPVTPMTSSKATVTAAINGMKAVGLTHINLGAVWAWRMLSPRWRDLWGGEMDTNDLPLDYNTPRMKKALVLMTDGDNTMYANPGGNYFFTAYGFLSQGRLGTTNATQAEANLDARLTTVCNSAKGNTTRTAEDDRVVIYTVVFGTVTSATQTLMRNCASQDDFYFASPTAADLQLAFRTIGDSLANLRVSR